LKTVIVATDFSTTATNAVNYAVDMALAIKAGILLFHVYQIPVIYSELPVAFSEEDTRHDIKKNLIDLKLHIIQKTGGKLNIETEVRLGSFFPELKTLCENIMPYTVVMGSQGTTFTERLLFGSHTVYAMKYLMWPIITVPPNASFSAVKKIGIACDLSKAITTMPIDEINILVKDFDAELHILNIDKWQVHNPSTDCESILLQQMMTHLKPTYHFITDKNTDEAILDFVDKNSIDLLIVLPRRRGLLRRLIHRSHTKQLILYSHVPVMALHFEIL